MLCSRGKRHDGRLFAQGRVIRSQLPGKQGGDAFAPHPAPQYKVNLLPDFYKNPEIHSFPDPFVTLLRL